MVRKELLDSIKDQYKNIKSSSLLVLLKDLDGNILYGSDSFAAFLNTKEPLKEQKTTEIFEDEAEKINETDRYVIENQQAITIDVCHQRKKWLKLDKMPYYNADE